MKLKDKNLQKIIDKARCNEVWYRVENYMTEKEMESEGESEIEYLLREIMWLVEDWEEDGHVLNEDLRWARSLLNETNYGKRIPIDINRGFKPKQGYEPREIERAKETVNEYNRTKRLYERLDRIYEEQIEKSLLDEGMSPYEITYFLKPEAENITFTIYAVTEEEAIVFAKEYREGSFKVEMKEVI